MDGYPKTLEQAKILFAEENLAELDEEIDEEEERVTSDSVMPELVVSLEATDEFLIERVIQQSERDIQGTHYTEEHMMRRLKEYRYWSEYFVVHVLFRYVDEPGSRV